MKISIITTVYKAENDLPRLLDSMMSQDSEELEFYLIDNGSEDKCGSICETYAKKDPRFKVIHLEKNIGYIRARNYGIEHCTGDYIGFCDSDDYLEPHGYDCAVNQIKATLCDLYITDYRTIFSDHTQQQQIPYDKGLYEKDAIIEQILPQAFGNIDGKAQLHGFAWKQIFKRSLIIENGFRFIPELQPYEDQIFNIDVIQKCNHIYIDDNILYNYIVNEQSITAKLIENFDAKAEWNRMTLLYQEKRNRISNSVEREACCNQMWQSIYIFVMNMSKQVGQSTQALAQKLKEVVDYTIIKEITIGATKNKDRSLNFIKYCLNKKQYYTMFGVIRLIMKLRG